MSHLSLPPVDACENSEDALPKSLEDLAKALGALVAEPSSNGLQRDVTCAAHRTLTAFSQVVRGSSQLSSNEREEVKSLLRHLNDEKMKEVATILSKSEDINTAKMVELEKELEQLEGRKRQLQESLRQTDVAAGAPADAAVAAAAPVAPA
nr:uncharacterized protein LOC128687000 [Cherax quadricarinatus]